jgi:hypothetical protein
VAGGEKDTQRLALAAESALYKVLGGQGLHALVAGIREDLQTGTGRRP